MKIPNLVAVNQISNTEYKQEWNEHSDLQFPSFILRINKHEMAIHGGGCIIPTVILKIWDLYLFQST